MRGAFRMGAVLAGFIALSLRGDAETPLLSRIALWVSPSLRDYRDELAGMDSRLARLPKPMGANSNHRFGYVSMREGEGDLWVELAFPTPVRADRVVLIPTTTKDTHGRVQGYGFPRRFMLEGINAEGEGQLLMNESGRAFPNPGDYPVSAFCALGTEISRLRLTVSEPWDMDSFQAFSLAEIMVISGNSNVAPQASVTTGNSRENLPVWSRTNLTDNFTPLGLPLLPGGSGKLGWQSDNGTDMNSEKSVSVDLGSAMPIDEVRMVPAWQENEFGWNNYGLPTRFKIEAALTPDFSDAWMVYDRTEISLQTPGQNVQSYPGGGEMGRYVRITATRMRERTGKFFFALGELQVYSGESNRALHCKVTATGSIEDGSWGRGALTDGRAGGAALIELSQWFDALGEAHSLVKHRATVSRLSEVTTARTERGIVLASFGGTIGTALLAAGLVMRSRRQRIRDRGRHRERLARDLHDELGSNLGSIALISSFSGMEDTDPGQMRADLLTIEKVARESADSMRDLVGLLGGGKHNSKDDDWLKVMRGLAERVMGGIEVECRFPSVPLTEEPNLETRREIYLFCKEVMHNCARHSHAAHVSFQLAPTPQGFRITIADDGKGFDPAIVERGNGLGNLRERAAIMNAEMSLASTSGKGTTVTLDVPRGRRWTRKPKTK